MALTTQVKECTDTAAGAIREALAFAARAEQPIVISTLTDILIRLESIESMDELMHKFGGASKIPKSF